MGLLNVSHLSCGYGSVPVLSNVTFSVDAGSIHVLLGPNGVGKTTLFKTVLGFLPALSGAIEIDGRELRQLSRRELARLVAYVPQVHDSTFGYTVGEMVLMGRTPLMAGMTAAPTRGDERAADEVIERLRLERLADRDVTELSGGEQQMVLVARALAADPRLIVMDEPCASLDFGNQALLLTRLGELRQQGVSILMTSHDPNHAFALDADVTCLGRDGLVATGTARELLSPDLLGELYGVEVAVGQIYGASGSPVLASAPVTECMAGRG